MPILEGAYWISTHKFGKYLKADADGTVCGVGVGPRGVEILDSTALRARIWLVEKAASGKNFRLRNYETGCALDIKNRVPDGEPLVIASRGSTENQLWDINQFESDTDGLIYKITNVVTSDLLCQIQTDENRSITVSTLQQSHSDQMWLIEPAVLPSLYQLAAISAGGKILYAPDYPNASDSVSGEVALGLGGEASVRSRLWIFEYTSINECFVRSALHHQFALDLAPDGRSVMVREYCGELSQRWVIKDKDTKIHTINLVSAKTGTLLASDEHQLFESKSIYNIATALRGNVDWQIQTSPQPPLFWVAIQHSSGGFLGQANDRTIVLSRGALNANDRSVQWGFIMVGNDLQYVIMNRATGFVLGFEYTAAVTPTTYSGSTTAKDEDRHNINNRWILCTSGDNYATIVHVGSKYKLSRHSNSPYSCLCQMYPGSSDASSWIIAPLHDSLPSFALVNPYTGRCLAYNPEPELGTISAVDDINDTRSQWLFYEGTTGTYANQNPVYFLLNKMTGSALERSTTSGCVEAHGYFNPGANYDPTESQAWKMLPLAEGLISLSGTHTETRTNYNYSLTQVQVQYFLNDVGIYGPKTEASSRAAQFPCWYLVSQRQSGFDFISLDFDIMKQLIVHIPGQATSALSSLVMRYQSANEGMKKGASKSAHVPGTSRSTRAINDGLRVILAHLVRHFAEDSISQAREPGTILAVTRSAIEQRWGTSLSQRSLRRRSDEPGWVRIDLQGIYDVGGSWKANILGKWLDTPMLQVIVPADIHIGRTVVQQAMLQSMEQGLTVEVRETPSELAIPLGESTRPGIIELNPRRPGFGGGEEGMNSLIRTLSTVPISSLRHDRL